MRGLGIGKSDEDDLKGITFGGFVFVAKLVHTTVNTAFTGQPFDWQAVNISAKLIRGGKEFTIFDDTALQLFKACGFKNGTFEQVMGEGTPLIRVLRAEGASVKAIAEITAKLRLPGVVNLAKDDVVKFEIQVNDSAVDSTLVDIASSEVRWDVEEAVGNSLSIPFIASRSIKGGEDSNSVALGDNVESVFFINNDKAGILSADQVITSINLKSDKISRRETIAELNSKRNDQFDSHVEADARNNCYRLVCMKEENYSKTDARLNKVVVDYNLNSSNVTQGANWIVYTGFYPDTMTKQRALARFESHKKANASQYNG